MLVTAGYVFRGDMDGGGRALETYGSYRGFFRGLQNENLDIRASGERRLISGSLPQDL